MENLESTLKCNDDDDDLNDLLDSALEEFEQVPRMMNKKKTMSTDTGTTRLKKNISGSEVQAELEKLNGLSVEERKKGLQDVLAQLDVFMELRKEFENVYGKTRILHKPENYILDQDHHVHLANQSLNFDWQFLAEIKFFEKLEAYIKSME